MLLFQDTFAPLSGLSILRLDSNLLSVFPVWQLAANPLLGEGSVFRQV